MHGYGKYVYEDGFVQEGIWNMQTFIDDEEYDPELFEHNPDSAVAFDENDIILSPEELAVEKEKAGQHKELMNMVDNGEQLDI